MGIEWNGRWLVNVAVVVFSLFSFLAYMLPCDGFCLRFVQHAICNTRILFINLLSTKLVKVQLITC